MIKRWVIRSLALLLFAACITAWRIAWVMPFDLPRGPTGTTSFYWNNGVFFVAVHWSGIEKQHPSDLKPFKEEGTYVGGGNAGSTFNHFGFRLGYGWLDYPAAGVFNEWRYVGVPCWFPTAIAAGILWIVWRKTRPKPLGHAFPVEPDAKPRRPKP